MDTEQIWFVYLVECADGSLYCGITTNLERRLAAHNGERPGGAKYTRSRRPVRLAAAAAMQGKSAAASLEAKLRGLAPAVKLARLRAEAGEGGEQEFLPGAFIYS